jgi:hypothetical protein
MATIFDNNGDELTAGLQGSSVCDEALMAAREFAKERDETVLLEDDDGRWLVHPNGKCERWTDGDEPERTEAQWWAWHDADDNHWSPGEDPDEATAEAQERCAAWVSGDSDDGPTD